MDYVEAATQLGEAIAESGELLRFREAEQAILADSKAQQLMQEFRQMQGEMVEAARKQEMSKEDLEKVRDTLLAKQNELDTYAVTKQYFDARQGFEVMMKTVNDILQYYIDGQEHAEGCGGNCAGCSGCH